MPAVQRQDDLNDAGAAITSGFSSVRVNNKPVSVDGSAVAPHAKKNSHRTTTANGVSSVRAGNKPINTKGNADGCGHVRVGGSPNVRAG